MMRPECPEWKPGDFQLWVDDAARRFTWRDPSEVVYGPPSTDAYNYRPLVVIDPEDAEQVERLTLLHLACYGVREGTRPEAIEKRHMADALREFARPTPRIDEPQGLGAVVEAIYDNHFVHLGNGHWSRVGPHDCAPCAFEEIEVVRVLSEGVTP